MEMTEEECAEVSEGGVILGQKYKIEGNEMLSEVAYRIKRRM
jgi:hypothetical protein